jgi:hypothetical protein
LNERAKPLREPRRSTAASRQRTARL